jgi:NAD(P)-dependent dehydrogenase (short-subunit alcohol dehydrogenase family)
MTERLSGKHALVTGGTRGIGEGIVRLFVKEGARVVFTGRDVVLGEALSKETGALFRPLELTDEAGWQRLGAEFTHDPFDVLVNNAGGIIYAKPLLDLTIEEWHRDVAVNLTGPFLGMRTFLPSMLARGSGSIINIGSISGVRAQPDGTAYQSAKAGLRWLTKNAAMTYAARGVRVNTINPGVIVSHLIELQPSKRLKWFTDRIPMQRNGQPYEVATAAVFLVSDESTYVTGVDLDVDGGYNL